MLAAWTFGDPLWVLLIFVLPFFGALVSLIARPNVHAQEPARP